MKHHYKKQCPHCQKNIGIYVSVAQLNDDDEPHGNDKHQRNLKIWALKKEGKRLREIADEFGLTYQAVQQIIWRFEKKSKGSAE